MSKPHFSLQALFAEGITSAAAIDALLRHAPDMTLRALALNRSLNAEQLTKLLGSGLLTVEVIAASRYDLTNDHAMQILKGSRPLPRQAFLTRPISNKIWDQKNSISEAALDYALSQQWFTSDHAYATLLNFAQTLTIKQRQRLDEASGLLQTKSLHGPNARPTFPHSPSFKSAKSKINHLLQNADFNSYLAYTGRQEMHPERLDDLLSKDCFNLLNSINRYSEPARSFVAKVEERIGPATSELYDIFFQTMPDWNGSILELISMVHSLTSQSVS